MRAERLQPVPTRPTGGMAGFGAAVVVSLGLHAALFFALANRAPEGLDAETEAISVEIVVEAAREPAAGPAAVEAQASAEQPPEETAASEFDAPAPPPEAASILAEPPEITAKPAPAEQGAAPAFDAPLPPAAALSLLAGPPAIAAEPELPQMLALLPSPRPQAEAKQSLKPQAEREKPRRQEATEQRAEPKAKPVRKKASHAEAERAQRPSQETTASAGGGASARSRTSAGAAGEASYARRLVAHLQRFKRYPDDAARRRISGATKLAVTIDRGGRLAGARVTASSGHAILDQEALAAAQRAAPYPRPPDGVGGATVAIAVTLRFAPR